MSNYLIDWLTAWLADLLTHCLIELPTDLSAHFLPTDRLNDWSVDWLHVPDLLTYWLTDWQTDWLTDWFSHGLTDWFTSSLTHRHIDWLTDLLTYWLTDWWTDCLNDLLTHSLIDWLTDWPAHLLTDRCTCNNWPVDWLTDVLTYWLTDCLTAILTDLLTDLIINLQANWLADWPNKWLAVLLIIRWLTDSHRLIDCLAGSLTNWLDWLADVLRFILRKEMNFNVLMMWIKIIDC